MPERFLFVELGGLDRSAIRCATARAGDHAAARPAASPRWRRASAPSISRCSARRRSTCSRKRSDRINVSDREAEHHDRARPHAPAGFRGVQRASRWRAMPPMAARRSRSCRSMRPTISAEIPGTAATTCCAASRASCPRAARQRGPRSSYLGHELFISLVDAEQRAAQRHDLRQLGLDLLCTNRDLPLSMPVGKQHTDFTIAVSAPVASIRCLVGPTAPRPCRGDGDYAWRFISHLGLNYLSLTDTDSTAGRGGAARIAAALRAVHGVARGAPARRAALGRVATRSSAAFPVPARSPSGAGLEITLTIDEGAVRRRRRHPAGCRARPVLRQICLDQCVHRNGAAQPRARRGDAMADANRPAADAVRRADRPSRRDARRRGPIGSASCATGRPPDCARRAEPASRRLAADPLAAPGLASTRRCGCWRRCIATGRASAAASAPPRMRVRLARNPRCHLRPGHAGGGSSRGRRPAGPAAGAFLRPVRPRRPAAAAPDRICPRPPPQPSRPDASSASPTSSTTARCRCSIAPGRMSRPTVSFDRPEQDRFAIYVGALIGLGMDSVARPRRDAGPDQAAFRRPARLPDAQRRRARRRSCPPSSACRCGSNVSSAPG